MHSSSYAAGRWMRALALAVTILLLAAGCTDESTDEPSSETAETVAANTAADLLGPDDPASGEPVKIGLVGEGSTPTLDTTDELRGGEATAEFLNQHRGGIGGRPIEVVTCEMKADPAVAADCANRLIEEDVVAVTVPQAAVTESLWEPLHAAGVPVVILSGFGEAIQEDDQSTFLMVNPVATFFGLPVALAEAEDVDKVAFVVIDVPQATDLLEADGGATLERAGIDYEIFRVPLGTADMTPQMQQVVDSGAGVVHILGNDAFCIAAVQGLKAVAYDGVVAGVAQCLTDATREALGADLEGFNVLATLADGALDDPTYQLYQAVMGEYGDEVRDVEGYYALGGYAAVATLAAALETIEGDDVTPETVIETIKNMPETELPAAGGVTFSCGGSAMASQPAICTNQWLRTVLDADGEPTTYTVEDSTDLVS